jgi:hypothetical protein
MAMSYRKRELAGWLTILQGSAVDSGENRFLHVGSDGQPIIHKQRMRDLRHLASASPTGRVIVTKLVPTSLFREWKGWPSTQKYIKNPASVIPLKWIPARVRRLKSGQVQVAVTGRGRR